ncbi:ATP-dependent Lhr-like helicase [Naumannella cuiyingiana]|uniref:ATP-dependent Lhr-like helicase n=1 Tax=Naumannella cuiyingiana TaxID=1347891 RepID=A0A7Z0DBW0_9ACTN|nr:ATP-dependent helicase [Naumannella cuiyingiana]NYI72496.1 ATP-dependent Lhr-like helicase [Naumannella cuiyingiana]
MTTARTTGIAGGDALAGFAAPTRAWFAGAFRAPTQAQSQAWAAIGSGHHTLVVAPTGSGKTLAAFLSAIDRLASRPAPASPRTSVLYVSPLKALAVDVDRNLRAPLQGIAQAAQRMGEPFRELSVGVRSGDTSTGDRRRLVRNPPDILITTPESLHLMLTSVARETLREVETVIIDEVHALAGTKRGAHLALGLERLASLSGNDIQRIGLSATVRPPERVAAFLTGSAPTRPIDIVAPPSEKRWDLDVVVPVEDMTDLAPPPDADPAETSRSIWPHIERRILDQIGQARSTIVFTNSRRQAERMTTRLNELHAQRSGIAVERDQPAEIPAQAGTSAGLPDTAVIARAHHGSVSREQREQIESALKAGTLPCVVATSSLELGIDMGAVDQVIQASAPPSVAGGLQRVGRAGHDVGATSRGTFYPTSRGDLLETAVVVQRMREGAIEEVATLDNPLDVLAQQIVAITALDPIGVDDLYALVRRAQPFARLTRGVFESVLNMLAGRYPSEEFRELRPRLVWDRQAGTLTGRPGGQRLAIISGGTIPDRGLFGVFLVGSDEGTRRGPGRRVGELDEEMVYESRVGDVFTLGTTSWRIEEITHDQVLVSPAPGQPGKLPFWRGDAQGRPLELGRALGAFTRELSAAPAQEAKQRLTAMGLDANAARGAVDYLAEQRAATGALPTDRQVIFERFRDELGDWRVCVHAPFGTAVLAPWALLIEARARDRLGLEVHARASDDGIVLQIPDTDAPPPAADLIVFDAEQVEELVTEQVADSALFAARFRECAARALLLPRRSPTSRSPLWQQRMRAAQLLTIAARHPDFPIMLETMRECLSDVFDLAGLVDVQRRAAGRDLAVVEVETPQPSPYARSLLFGYVGEYVYTGDLPLNERRNAALSLDLGLLAELLGKDAVSELLDADVIAGVEDGLQARTEGRQAGSAEQLFDLIRSAGPYAPGELAARSTQDPGGWLADLIAARRVAEVRIAGRPMIAAAEDLGLLREALGVPTPAGYGTPDPPDDDPIGALTLRWALTHGPFTAAELADRYGIGQPAVLRQLRALTSAGALVEARFTEAGSGADQWCHHRVLGLIRRRMLAKLRDGIEPVEPAAYARFLPRWHGIAARPGLHGVDGVLSAIEQLAGAAVPLSSVETTLLPSRVADYAPAMLDELLASGEIDWVGDGAIGEHDGWVRFGVSGLELERPQGDPGSPEATELLRRLAGGGAWFFDDLLPGEASRTQWASALWQLVWAGLVRSDSFGPARALLASQGRRRGRPARPNRPRSRTALSAVRAARVARTGSPTTAGRWSVVPEPEGTPDSRFTAGLLAQLDRYAVLTRGAVQAENSAGGFGAAYRGLSVLEEQGQCRRGYVIDGLGAAQFALPGAVDRLRADAEQAAGTVLLAATDPANPYGAALPWPERAGHRPGRKPGALVVLVEGNLALFVERGARTVLTFSDDTDALDAAAAALADGVRRGWLGTVLVERIDAQPVFEPHSLVDALTGSGFRLTPQGLRLRAVAG